MATQIHTIKFDGVTTTYAIFTGMSVVEYATEWDAIKAAALIDQQAEAARWRGWWAGSRALMPEATRLILTAPSAYDREHYTQD